MGDPSGIGPEIILKSLVKVKNIKDLQIFGSKEIFKKTARDLGIVNNYEKLKDNIIDCVNGVKFTYGKPTIQTANVAIASIDNALCSKPDIMITAPIVKWVIKKLRPSFIGHTEYLAGYYGVEDFAMVGVLGKKRIMLLTTHIPLRDVFKMVKAKNIFNKIVLLKKGLKRYFKINNPAIGVSALNPHSYEFTKGEEKEIEKGIHRARVKGINAQGPFPADSLFNLDFDGFLAIYHDQAFIFLKSKKGGVNWTLGLPIIRLSPLYGAALDIAGKNIADFSGMISAIRTGIAMYKNSSG